MRSRAPAGGGTLLAAGAVLVAVAAAQLLTGLGVGSTGRWLAVLVGAVLLPGAALSRVARRSPASLADDLAWAMPAGLMLTLLTWWVGQLIGARLSPWWQPVLVGVLVVAVPVWRRRLTRRADHPGWGLVPGSVVSLSLLVAVLWTATTGLAALPVRPTGRGYLYSPDQMFHVAMVGELSRTAVPTYPMVAGEPMSYHWFVYAVAAQLGRGIDTLSVVSRLLPVTLVLGLVLLVASVAHDIAGRGSAAAVGAALVGLLGNTLPSGWVVRSGIPGRFDAGGGALAPVRTYWQHSPTQTLGWLAGVACLGALVRLLRPAPRLGAGVVALVALTGFFAAGAKSSVPPVLLCGVAAAGGVALLRRDWTGVGRAAVAGTGVGGAFLLALSVVYPGGSYGLRLMPGDRADVLAAQYTPALVTRIGLHGHKVALGVALVAAVVWLAPLVPRVLGLWWQVREEPRDPMGWVGVGLAGGGVAGTFLTRHPGYSELFFVVSAYPLVLAVSAAGWTALGARLADRLPWRRLMRPALVVAGLGVVATAAVAAWAGTTSPHAVWAAHAPKGVVPGAWLGAREQLLAWSAPVAVLGAGAIAVAGGALALTGRLRRASASGPVRWATAAGALALVAGGAVSTWEAATNGDGESVAVRLAAYRPNPHSSRPADTAALVRAGRVVAEQAAADDVVATNRMCAQGWSAVTAALRCDPRDFSVAAFTGRRTDVGGWGYADREVAASWDVPGGYRAVPFWDPARLAAARAVVESPTPEVIRAAWQDRGVRWVLADRSAGPVSDHLADFGTVVFDNGGVIVVRLAPPS
jgi:hypothetical protein